MDNHKFFNAGTLQGIPVVTEGMAIGAGSHTDDGLAYMSMPKEMLTFQPPILPEPEEMQAHPNAVKTLNALLEMVHSYLNGNIPAPMSLLHLSDSDITMINRVLGEGEVSATISAEKTAKKTDADNNANDSNDTHIAIQETIFIGVWRIIAHKGQQIIYDALEVNSIPTLIKQTAIQDSECKHHPAPIPDELYNVPPIVHEVHNYSQQWHIGKPIHVVNLTLLPVSEMDIAYIDNQLGTGRITVLSRGYGNCRITNTLLPNVWRLVYYNSMDKVILNAIEVSEIPEVACASLEDLTDTKERLTEVLAWL
ncbi:MAG: hydrogenase expression/formation protein [Gammaproteobacteria bacterium]|nr:hydrogenase expression/formation protein [Gammaproteobacteria bacterium]